MNKRIFHTTLCLIVLGSMLLASAGNSQVAMAVQPLDKQISKAAAPQMPNRGGAWIDSITFTVEADFETAIDQLQSGEIDLYSHPLADPLLYQIVKADHNLAYTQSLSKYTDLTFNPAGPNFNDGRLNPFHNATIREAMNLLIDRSYIVNEIYGGLGYEKYLPVTNGFYDYVRYMDTCNALETTYAYDLTAAQSTIETEMIAMGATLVNDIWTYNSEPITLTFIIRVEDERTLIGDYIASQLETIGFIVDRQYKTSQEASPIWLMGDPTDGQWHLYTGGWVTSEVDRDQSGNFTFFYTPHDWFNPLWQAYTPSPAFDAVAVALRDNTFSSIAERDALFEQALGMSLNDSGSGSVRIWLVDVLSFYPRRDTLTVSSGITGGILGAHTWPYVIRFNASEGGDVHIGQAQILVDPWNPIAGSSGLYDLMPIRATADWGLLNDPNTGLPMPQRIIGADVVVQAGLPVTKTLDWVSLSFTSVITVPADAWVDWDASAQQFITADEKFPGGTTAMVRSTVYYPPDLFTTVTWHDGSSLSIADFIYFMIMQFDPGKPESPAYNEELAWRVENFLSHFKGVRIISTDPLIIETYEDIYQTDAERSVNTWFPSYSYGPGASQSYGPGPWHTVALGYLTDAAGELAFSAGKADALGIEWMDFVDGPSISILSAELVTATMENHIPFTPTLSAYISPTEATARWANLTTWFAQHANFWVGSGPFYLNEVNSTDGYIVLERFGAFPDIAGKWDEFAIDAPAMEISFFNGAPGSYLNVTGSGYAPGLTASIYVNNVLVGTAVVSADGTFAFTLDTQNATPGLYVVTVTVEAIATTEIVETERFVIDVTAPVRPLEGANPIVVVPEDIACQAIYLPTLIK